MQAAADEHDGTMAAIIGLDDDAAEAAVSAVEDCWVANFNTPGQVVIAGGPAGVDAGGAACKAAGAKRVMPLVVGGAFHTPHMAPAQERLDKALSQTDFRAPDHRVFANVDATPYTSAEPWPRLLHDQLTGSVRWRHTLTAMVDAGYSTFVEIGPGTALTGMVKRTARASERLNVTAPGDLDSLLEALGGRDTSEPAEGEHLYVTERLVVSPCAGVFIPDNDVGAGTTLQTGSLLGTVGDSDVRSAFSRPAHRVPGLTRRTRAARPADRLAAFLMSAGRIRGSRITGWASALPDEVITNDDLAKTLDTSHDWIVDRTGIHSRHIGGNTHDLSVESGKAAIARAGLTPTDIDMVILATTTPDKQCPATASVVQDSLGITGGAFDLQAACSGFVYALAVADGLITTGAEHILVIGTDTLSNITDWEDRGTAILFADGSGSMVVSATEGAGNILSWSLGSDGSLERLLYADHHGGKLQMIGKEVFRSAVTYMVNSSRDAMEKAGVDIDDIALVVPHQANIRIIESAARRLGAPMDKVSVVLDHTGNTSSASIPLAFVEAEEQGRISPGDLMLMTGFGAGMSSASAVIRWDP